MRRAELADIHVSSLRAPNYHYVLIIVTSGLLYCDTLPLTYLDLLSKSEEVYSSCTLTEEQVKAVETATRDQSKSITWYQQRAGRVTAS